MKKSLIILIAGLIALIPAYSFAQPQNYTYTYNSTNLYYGYTLEYEFTGLDSAQQYVFSIQQVSNDNVPIKTYQEFVISGATTYDFSFSGFPDDTFTPFRVVDNFGQTLGQHYLAPLPDADWFTSDGTNPNTDKIGISNVPYQELNAFGFHQPIDDVDAVTTRQGNYTLIHYFTSVPTDEFIKLNIVGGAEIYEFSIEDFVDYNIGIGWAGDTSLSLLNYVVLNTAGVVIAGYGYGAGNVIPPFISPTQNALITLGDNPHRAVIANGVYEYAKVDELDVLIAVGESLWLVSEVDSEYEASVNPSSVAVERDVRVRLTQHTENIWQGLINKSLTDENEGLISDDFNIYQDTYIFLYPTTNLLAETDVVVTWRNEPFDLNYGEPDEFYFDVLGAYNIVLTTSFLDKANAVIVQEGMDSLFGYALITVALIFIGAVFVFMNGLGALAMQFMFVGVLIMVMMLPWFDLHIDILLGILATLGILSIFKFGGLSGEN